MINKRKRVLIIALVASLALLLFNGFKLTFWNVIGVLLGSLITANLD